MPEELHGHFLKWVTGISLLKHWKISRCYTSVVLWTNLNVSEVELHGFGDASEQGYGPCIYLKLPKGDGSFETSLVISRAKVAPLKKLTLPRLELLGSLLCARLIRFVQTSLRLSDQVACVCWTDSQVALSWIKGDASKWKPFVANRVRDIQELTSPSCWFHCMGKDNSADLMTRGLSAQQLLSADLWLKGPTWLVDCRKELVENASSVNVVDLVGELNCISVTPSTEQLCDFERWGTFVKSIRVIGWIQRFFQNLKVVPRDRQSGDLKFEELSKAKTILFSLVQRTAYCVEIEALKKGKSLPMQSSLKKLDPFLGTDGLLRMKGRLQLSDLGYESKHPIILPSCHVTKLLVMFQHKHLKHAGVSTLMTTLRNTYWIVGLRQLSKRVCRECVPCRRIDSRACSQPVAPLPDLRVKCAPPFTVTGLDYAGPLFCLNFPKTKFYILLFTCAVVRSVHLELTDSLCLSDCLLAVRRFSARRGLPTVFYSDNATTFTAMSNKLKQYFCPLSPQ